ncbi:hypothetical protein BU24DRAFT_428716 [Aaosphaeria arxii CBS 175.79]|uniref:PXA domain-containing protein n=1 Tax=Aaosphaeria arxii CBS 175.79 TaxID=1450172 RepID=A0A6A5X818_9PLEO|nr:uncharacterized protein BU24DRAFT_428716 [Aaosphaeria arxii CBS 175.79]KAF2009185.1 hypothetical protein BU24DRAFT_428716 [Aaosphaeria arxii CBS 175.79]
MTQSMSREPETPHAHPNSNQASTTFTTGNASGAASDQIRPSGAMRHSEAQKPTHDTNSDKATSAFIRRTLCSHDVLLGNGEKGRNTPRPIEDVLPPLTSSNAVDLQLYAIISVIIKEFVQTWYSKITPDHIFINEVIQTIAHCTRALEQRLRKIDLEALVLDEIPGLLEDHLTAFRLARSQASHHGILIPDPRTVYHTLNPHPALSPVPTDAVPASSVEQRENESAWRQLLVQGVLAVLLPTEDLANGCLRSLVAEIFAEMIIGNGISGKACEGWLLWEGITRIAEVLQHSTTADDLQSDDLTPDQSLSRLERFGLLSTPAEGEGHGVSTALSTSDRQATNPRLTVSGLFWAVVQYAFLAYTVMRAMIVGIATSSSLPGRSTTGASVQSPDEGDRQPQQPSATQPKRLGPLPSQRPIVRMRLWACASKLIELDLRMPWLSGLISAMHWGALFGPGRVGDTDGVLDRFLSHTMRMHVFNPALLPILLRTIRATLFPNNALAPPRQVPTAEEAKNIKRRCAATLLDLLPGKVAAALFNCTDSMVQLQQVEEILDCLDDPYLNKHFIFSIVELIILRLVPELGERGIHELIEERLG